MAVSREHYTWNLKIFKCNVLYLPANYHFYMPKYVIWNFQVYCSHWHPIITFTCNLKISSVMFSTYRQLSLLYMPIVVCNLKFSGVIFSTYRQLSLSSVLFSTDIQLSLLSLLHVCNLKISSVMFSTYRHVITDNWM